MQNSSRDEKLIGSGLNHWLQLWLLLFNITVTRCHLLSCWKVHIQRQLEGRAHKNIGVAIFSDCRDI